MEQPLTRRERERRVRRQTMLEAARVVIAEKGFKQATLDEIAQRAEFGKGTLYNYFPDGKREMLFAILDDVYDDLYSISKDAFSSADGAPFSERLHRYVESFLRYFMRQRELFVIVMKEANRIAFGDEESSAGYFKNHLERLVSVLEPAIEEAVGTGELRAYYSKSVAHMILGNVHGYLRYNCFEGVGSGVNDRDTDAEATRAADFLCGILLDGMAERNAVAPISNGKESVDKEAS